MNCWTNSLKMTTPLLCNNLLSHIAALNIATMIGKINTSKADKEKSDKTPLHGLEKNCVGNQFNRLIAQLGSKIKCGDGHTHNLP